MFLFLLFACVDESEPDNTCVPVAAIDVVTVDVHDFGGLLLANAVVTLDERSCTDGGAGSFVCLPIQSGSQTVVVEVNGETQSQEIDVQVYEAECGEEELIGYAAFEFDPPEGYLRTSSHTCELIYDEVKGLHTIGIAFENSDSQEVLWVEIVDAEPRTPFTAAGDQVGVEISTESGVYFTYGAATVEFASFDVLDSDGLYAELVGWVDLSEQVVEGDDGALELVSQRLPVLCHAWYN